MRPIIVLLFGILLAPIASAVVVSGRVTNAQGTGIADVDLDFIDRDTDQSITLVNDNTDFLGFYAVDVPAGDYDVRFEPAPGDRYVGIEERGVQVEGGGVSLDMELESGWFLSGSVVDGAAMPVTDLDLDFVDSVDGPIFIANDRTDATGSFSVVVPGGSFDIEFEPAIGIQLAPLRIDAVAVAADTSLGQITMQAGHPLRGSVLLSGIGLGGVLVQLVDPFTGLERFAIRNSTDAAGQFDFVVAEGPLDLLLVPPRGAAALPRSLSGIVVGGTTDLPPLSLDPGVLVSGSVRGPGNVDAEGTDLDFTEIHSRRMRFTPRDNADENGQFAIAVSAGSYEIDFTPPGPSGWAPARLSDVTLLSNTVLPTVHLATGRTVSGLVTDGAGTPLPGVDLDFLVAATGEELYTDDDNADASGSFSVVVPSGTYDIVFSPVAGSGVGRLTLSGVTVGGNLSLGTQVLPTASAASALTVAPPSGSTGGGTAVTVTGGNFAPGVDVRLGGVSLTDVTVVNPTTLTGTTAPHPRGTVALAVTNPGAPTAQAPTAFTYLAPIDDPLLVLTKGGPLGTDLLLDWSGNAAATYRVFRTQSASQFETDASPRDAVVGTSYRDDGAASATAPPLLFYLVQ